MPKYDGALRARDFGVSAEERCRLFCWRIAAGTHGDKEFDHKPAHPYQVPRSGTRFFAARQREGEDRKGVD